MSGMKRLLPALLLPALLAPAARAADLRVYPSFAEVIRPAPVKVGERTFTLPLTRNAWAFVLPGSFSVSGAATAEVRVQPTDLPWLRSQEGQPVKVLRAGLSPLEGRLIRADDLLVQLASGEYLNPALSELAFASPPPPGGPVGGVGVRVTLAGPAASVPRLSYRTAALSWTPRYELEVSGTSATLAALAEVRNRSEETFSGKDVELYAGTVRVAEGGLYTAQDALLNRAVAPATVSSSAGVAGTAGPVGPAGPSVASLGEVRGLQRYALRGGLELGARETLTVPFVQPNITAFTRYNVISSYFQAGGNSGSTLRRYKFTPDRSLPTGAATVRESGALVGQVTLPAAQAGQPVELDLGADPELRFTRSVKRLSLEKDPQGRVLSTTYEVTYTLRSTKSSAARVQLRERVYGRSVVVDGQAQASEQVNIERGVQVPAGGEAKIVYRVKIGQ